MVTRLGRWLVPALFGPLLGAWAIVLWLLVRSADRDAWIVGVLVATLGGGMQGILLILVDATLLRMRRRLLPMGGRAWAMGFVAPFATLALWILIWPRDRIEPPAVLVYAPMVATAIGLRLLFSPRFAS